MTEAEERRVADAGPSDAASYTKAILNILDDFGDERARQSDNQRALLNIIEDFDLEKRRVESAETRTTELSRSNRELEVFAYVASHDLQEPLRMITSFTQLLAKRYRGHLDSTADEYIDFIVDGAGRMTALIDDLLDYSRVGTKELEFAWVDGEDTLAAVLANLRTRVAERGATVTHDRLPSITADGSQLAQLFQNLVENALKFCAAGRRPVVHVGARAEGDGWTFFVRDNGIGIDSSHQEKIFQAFQRLHQQEYPGTGIGLAICTRIVERHHGRLTVDSELGTGSTFSFTLPTHATTS